MLISVLGEPDVTIIGPDPMVDVSQIYLPSVISVSKKLHLACLQARRGRGSLTDVFCGTENLELRDNYEYYLRTEIFQIFDIALIAVNIADR